VSDQTSASLEDREVYEFATKLLVNTTVDIAVILSLAYLLGILPAVALSYMLVAVLKYFAGGAHASKMLNCLVTGTMLYTGIGLAARTLARLPDSIAWGAFLTIGSVALTVFTLYAPAVPAQKHLRSPGHLRRLRRGAMIALATVLAMGLAWLMAPFTAPELFWAGCMSLVWQSLILLPGSQRLFDNLERYIL
jgi:accessory gene regulator B